MVPICLYILSVLNDVIEWYLFRKLVNIKPDDMKKVFHFNANEKKTQKMILKKNIFKFETTQLLT